MFWTNEENRDYCVEAVLDLLLIGGESADRFPCPLRGICLGLEVQEDAGDEPVKGLKLQPGPLELNYLKRFLMDISRKVG